MSSCKNGFAAKFESSHVVARQTESDSTDIAKFAANFRAKSFRSVFSPLLFDSCSHHARSMPMFVFDDRIAFNFEAYVW